LRPFLSTVDVQRPQLLLSYAFPGEGRALPKVKSYATPHRPAIRNRYVLEVPLLKFGDATSGPISSATKASGRQDLPCVTSGGLPAQSFPSATVQSEKERLR